MSVEKNKKLIEKWYIALAEGDFETIFDMHHDDVVYNMLGSTPVSGRIYGKDACCTWCYVYSSRTLHTETGSPSSKKKSSAMSTSA